MSGFFFGHGYVHNHRTNWKKIFCGALFEKDQIFALYDALASYIYDAHNAYNAYNAYNVYNADNT